MQTSNTEEMVTISRAEYERLQQKNAQLEANRVMLEAERIKLEAEHARLEAKLAAREQAQVITGLTLQNEWLLEQLKLSKKKLFGRSSEQAEQMVMEQLSLTYNELDVVRRVLLPRWWSTVFPRMNGSALLAVARWLRSARMCVGRCR